MRRICIFILSAMMSVQAFSENVKPRAAVFDPTSSGTAIDEGTKIAVREIVSSTIVNAGNYDIVERSLLEKVMQEQQFSNSGMVNDADATEIGKLAGADKVVLSVVTLTGGRNMISIKMIDVKTASVERQKVKVVSSGELLDVIVELTLSLIDAEDGSSAGGSVVSAQPRNTYYYNRSSSEGSEAHIPQSEFNGAGCITYKPCRYNIPDITAMSAMLRTEYFNRLSGNMRFNVILDFSDAKINGVPMLDYMNAQAKLDGSFYQKMELAASRFLKGLNNSAKGYSWSGNSSCPITLVVKVRSIDPNGRENVSDYVFVDTSAGTVLAGIKMKTKGGIFGSFANLLGDALEETAAPRLVKQLKAALFY